MTRSRASLKLVISATPPTESIKRASDSCPSLFDHPGVNYAWLETELRILENQGIVRRSYSHESGFEPVAKKSNPPHMHAVRGIKGKQ